MLVLIFPYTSLYSDEELNIKNYLLDDELDLCSSLENIKNELISLKFNDLLIDNNSNSSSSNTTNNSTPTTDWDNKNDRLDFLLTDPNLLKYFPKILMTTPENEPIKGNCEKLYEFLRY